MTRRRRWRWWSAWIALGGSAWLAGCGDEALDEPKPTAPNMAPLVEAYSAPTLALTAETAPAIVNALAGSLGFSSGLCGWGSTTDIAYNEAGGGGCAGLFQGIGPLFALSGASTQEEGLRLDGDALRTRAQALQIGDITIDGEGFLILKHVCPGWDGGTTPNPGSDGRLDLTIGFTDSGVDPVIWGTFSQCKYDIGGTRLLIDAAINLGIGQNLQLDGILGSPLLIELDARRLEIDGASYSGAFDMLINPAELSVSLRLGTADGHVILTSGANGFALQAANGVWACDISGGQCSQDNDAIGVSWP